MEQDLIQQDSRDARMRLRKFSEQSCMVPNVGNLCYVTCSCLENGFQACFALVLSVIFRLRSYG